MYIYNIYVYMIHIYDIYMIHRNLIFDKVNCLYLTP